MRFKSPAALPSSQKPPDASGRVSLMRGLPGSCIHTKIPLFHPLPELGSIDTSGSNEPQEQSLCGLGQGNGWEKAVQREGKWGKKEGKINGKDWDDIIAPLLCHQPHSKDLSFRPWFSLELPALLIPELSQSCSWLEKKWGQGDSRPCDIPLAPPSTAGVPRGIWETVLLVLPYFPFHLSSFGNEPESVPEPDLLSPIMFPSFSFLSVEKNMGSRGQTSWNMQVQGSKPFFPSPVLSFLILG